MNQAANLCLRISDTPGDASTPVPWLLMKAGQLIEQGVESLQILAERFGRDSTVAKYVLVPGDRVVLTTVNIPTQQAKYIRRALPYVVEELVAQDIHDVHIAKAHNAGQNGQYDIGIVKHRDLIQWLEMLFGAGVAPNYVVPDVLAVPRLASWNVLIEGDAVHIRMSEHQGLTVSPANAIEALKLCLADVVGAPSSATVQLGDTDSDAELAANLEAVFLASGVSDVECVRYRESSSEILMSTVSRAGTGVFNLLQGGYKSSRDEGRHLRILPVVGAAACALLLYAALAGSIGHWLQQKASTAKEEATQLYRSVYPAERRVLNPRLQMAQHLESAISGGDGSQFGRIMQGFSHAYAATTGIQVKHISFTADNSVMQVSLTAQSIDQVQDFASKLAGDGVSANILSAQQGDSGVEGRLKLEVSSQ